MIAVPIILALALAIAFARAPVARAALYYTWWRWKTRKQRIHGFVDTGDCHIHFDISGHGETLLLLHGGLVSRHVWFNQLPLFTRRYRIVSIDLRGHGKSSRGSRILSYRLMAEDIVKVLDQNDISSANVAGWSDGGNVALMLAIFFPGRVRRVVAISANAHPDGLDPGRKTELKPGTDPRVPLWARWVHEHVRSQASGQAFWRDVTTMWRTRPRLTADDLKSISSPVLLMRGEFDDVTESHTREMLSLIPGAKLVTVPGAGHRLLLQAPGAVADSIISFLSPAAGALQQSVAEQEPGQEDD